MSTPDALPVVGPPPSYDVECANVLAEMPAFPPLSLDTIPAMRAGSDGFMPKPLDDQLSREGAYLVETRRVPGPADAPSVSVVTCIPADAAPPTPALLYIHGGGMFSGTALDVLSDIVDLASAVGAAVVSVDYRLAPETPHPGPVEDCYASLTWVAARAAELNVDPERIVLIGGSAGGGLAAAVALLARDRGGPSILGQILMSPMLDDRNNSLSVRQMAGLRMWNQADNEVGWTALLGVARGGPDVSPYAAPARADDLANLPPAFIDVGSADSFRTEDVDYANRIWQAGGSAELHVWPGGYHGFDSMVPQAALSRAAVAARVNWLERLVTGASRER